MTRVVFTTHEAEELMQALRMQLPFMSKCERYRALVLLDRIRQMAPALP